MIFWVMRGDDTKQGTMLSLVTPEKRVPADHPLRRIKALAEEALRTLSPVFDEMYSSVDRPSIPPVDDRRNPLDLDRGRRDLRLPETEAITSP